jgi:hypothetical protein
MSSAVALNFHGTGPVPCANAASSFRNELRPYARRRIRRRHRRGRSPAGIAGGVLLPGAPSVGPTVALRIEGKAARLPLLTNHRLGPLMYTGILSEIEDELLPFGHALEPTPVLDCGPP